jgi:hypothetical protein
MLDPELMSTRAFRPAHGLTPHAARTRAEHVSRARAPSAASAEKSLWAPAAEDGPARELQTPEKAPATWQGSSSQKQNNIVIENMLTSFESTPMPHYIIFLHDECLESLIKKQFYHYRPLRLESPF